MFAVPGAGPVPNQITRDAAARVARNWWILLFSGVLLIVAGTLIFSIDWTIGELATFIGALFIFQGVADALTTGIDARVRQTNVIAGLLSIATGILIIVWPEPGLLAVAVVLGAWLIVTGTLSLVGSFAARSFLPNWWLLLIIGLLEIPLGVLALANPGRRSPRSSPSPGSGRSRSVSCASCSRSRSSACRLPSAGPSRCRRATAWRSTPSLLPPPPPSPDRLVHVRGRSHRITERPASSAFL